MKHCQWDGEAVQKRKLGNSQLEVSAIGFGQVELTREDVRALEDASAKIKLEGARYPKFHEQLVGR